MIWILNDSWVGIGFGKRMTNCDMMIARVDKGKSVIDDRYALGNINLFFICNFKFVKIGHA